MPAKTGFVASQARRHARNLWLANGLMVLISAVIFLANLPRIVEFVTGPHPLDEPALARARDAERVRQYHIRYEPAGDPEIVAKETSGRSWNLTTRWFLAYELAPGGKRFIVKARSEEGSPSYSGTLDPLPRELESHLDPDTVAPAYLDTTSDGWGMTWIGIIALIAAFGLGTANLIRFREQLFHSGEAPLLRAWRLRGELERNAGELDAEVEGPAHLFRDGWKMTPHWIYRLSAFGLKAIRLEDVSHAGARTTRQGRLWSSFAGPSLAVILRDRFGADAEIPASPDDRDDILRAVAEAAPHAEIHASLGA